MFNSLYNPKKELKNNIGGNLMNEEIKLTRKPVEELTSDEKDVIMQNGIKALIQLKKMTLNE